MALGGLMRGRGPVGPDFVHFVRGRDARILTLSMRRVATLVAYCAPYEFEDSIARDAGADQVEPDSLSRLEFLRRVYKVARLVTRSSARALRLTPPAGRSVLSKEYDLFFPVFNNPYELFALHAIPDWRARSRFAACFISEIWEQGVPEYLLELLRSFDRIYLGVTRPIEAVARITGRPVQYLPLATDTLVFAPYPDPPLRSIDVCGIGRRSPITHQALIRLARERGLFYYYDTVRTKAGVQNSDRQITFHVSNPAEHRFLLANLLKRSRYFIANRARANEPEVTRGVEEIAGRFFEGAAAGAIMLGAPPRTETFRAFFDWPDAVIPVAIDAPEIGDVISALEADPARCARIRRDGVVNSLLRHDWVHRLRVVFDACGLPPTEGMLAREARLRAIAQRLAAGESAGSETPRLSPRVVQRSVLEASEVPGSRDRCGPEREPGLGYSTDEQLKARQDL